MRPRLIACVVSREKLYVGGSVLSPMADNDDIEERMEGADEFFEGEDQWYDIDEYVDEDEEEDDE
jgi:hypothetical protein